MAWTNEQMEASFARFKDPNAAHSAEDTVARVDQAQRQIPGAYGHQADHYQLSTGAERQAFANAGQETRTNPSTLETENSPEAANNLRRTAKHIGATVAGAVPELREFGDILGVQEEAEAAETSPASTPSVVQQGNVSRQQVEAAPTEPSLADRLAGL